MSDLTPVLKTFGEATLSKGATPLHLPAKCYGLLALLCDARGRAVSRRYAMSMLWPAVSESSARHSLNQALFTLRRVLGPRSIDTSASHIRLLSELQADFIQLEDAIDANDAAQLQRITPGLFLDFLGFDSAAGFGHWRTQKAAALSSKLHRFFDFHISAALQRGLLADAESRAVTATGWFPDDADFRYMLVQARLEQNKIIAAHSAFVDIDAVVRNSNVVRSWEALTREHCREAARDGSTFVGRGSELLTVNKNWSQACLRQGSAMFVHGRPGIGKSSFCNACVSMLTDARVFRTAAYEAHQSVGFSTLADLLLCEVRSADFASLPSVMQLALQNILPSLTIPEPPRAIFQLSQAAAARRVLESAAMLFVHASRLQPILIVIDDLQWADDATLQWLEILLRRIARERIMVLTASRDRHSLEFSSALPISSFQLGDFDRDEVRALVEDVVERPIDVATINEVVSITRGYPLLTAELAVRLKQGLPLDLPHATDLVEQLHPTARLVIGVLAVAGLPLSLLEVERITGLSTTEIRQALRTTSRLCALGDTGTIDWIHDLMRVGVYAGLNDKVRRAHHRRMAEYLEAQTDYVGRAAEHWAKAGYPSRTVRLALMAAQENGSKHATQATCHFYQMALDNSDTAEERHEIRVRLADMLFGAGHFAEALPHLVALAEDEGGQPRGLAWASKALSCRLALRNTDQTQLLLEAIELETTAEIKEHHEALFNAIHVQMTLQGQRLADHRLTHHRERLLRLSQYCPETRIGVQARRLVAEHIAMTDDVDNGLVHAMQACEWAERIDDAELLIDVLQTLGITQYLCGDARAARDTLYRALKHVETSGAVLYKALVAQRLACVLTELDTRGEAEAQLGAVLGAVCVKDVNYYATAKANRALLYFHHQEFGRCIEVCDEIIAQNAQGTWLEVGVRGLRGLSYLEMGKLRHAKDEAGRLKVALASDEVIAGDMSFAAMLVARVAVLERTESGVEGPIRATLELYRHRDFVCRKRLQLALADVRARSAADEAYSLACEVLTEAEHRGLRALQECAAATIRRIKRRSWRVKRMALSD